MMQGNRSHPGDWRIFPAYFYRRAPRAEGSTEVKPGKMGLSPSVQGVNGY
jgi:hypothetical protein